MARLDTDILQRGTTAAIPAAADTPVGALYIETDSQQRVLRNNGTSWDFVCYAGGSVVPVDFVRLSDAASSAATNLALDTWSAVDDPDYRVMVDLRGMAYARLLGRIGGSLVAASKIRVQYNPTSDPTIATGDGGWAELLTSAGSHTLDTAFLTAAVAVPSAARIFPCLIRVGLYSGDGAADPTISGAMLTFYAADE
jgi:hypothetical protein